MRVSFINHYYFLFQTLSLCYHSQFDNKMFHVWMVEGANKDNSFELESKYSK